MKFKITSVSAQQESYYGRKGEPFRDRNKAYIFVSGESVIENLMNRRSRPYKFYQQNVLPIVLAEVKEKYPDLQISLDPKDWGWRQSCGCSMCPCSPGFIQKNDYGVISISAEVEFYEE